MIALSEANFKGLMASIVHCGAQLLRLTSNGCTEFPRLGQIEDPPWSTIRLKALRSFNRCLLARF
jgi:hypothetical protein